MDKYDDNTFDQETNDRPDQNAEVSHSSERLARQETAFFLSGGQDDPPSAEAAMNESSEVAAAKGRVDTMTDGTSTGYDHRSAGAESVEAGQSSASQEAEGEGTNDPYAWGAYDKPSERHYQDSSSPVRERPVIQYESRQEAKSRRQGLFGTLAMVLVGAILGSAITLGGGQVLFADKGAPTIQSPAGAGGNSDSDRTSLVTAPPAELGTTPENLIAEHVTPSVVGITTQTRVSTSNAGPFFFGFQGRDSVVQGVGSGVIVTEDGYILTNSHVVSNGEADKIQVIFHDETSVEGEVLWNDSTLDLAIVKADATGLTPVEIGSSDLVKVGDKAIAIGNPLGMDLQSTLTSGYISGLNRSINLSDGSTMSGLIQTDAAINEGNSGGALLNQAGQLIAINTAKAGGSTSGIGFAIPIDTAKPIIEKVIAEGSFQSVYLGVAGVDTQTVRAMGEELDYEGDGVFIMEIMAGTAADEAGLRKEDIITRIDGKPFRGMTELKKILLEYEVGDTVAVTYYRDNKEATLDLTFAQDSSNIDEYSTAPSTTTP